MFRIAIPQIKKVKNRRETYLFISVNIADVDASIFVPYKEFIFTFEKKEDKVFNGAYNLCSKKEVYASNGNVDNEGEFKCIVNLLFKKKS